MLFPQLFQYNDLGLLLLRIAVALIFLYHALPKLKNPKGMAEGMGMPGMGIAVLLLGSVELLSALGLILGIYVQLAALLLAIVMVGAIAMKTMVWHVPFAAMDKTGWEFDLVLLASNLVILFTNGGAFTVQ